MSRLAPLMSSEKGDWNTPQVIVDRVRTFNERPIGLDPCSNASSIVGADVEWTLERDGDSLPKPWTGHGLVYVNPPYGRGIDAWVRKCRETSWLGGEVIALVPARPDTAWWHDHCAPPRAEAVCFWRGRLTFVGAPAPAPFPSALVYWGPRKWRFRDTFIDVGAVWQ